MTVPFSHVALCQPFANIKICIYVSVSISRSYFYGSLVFTNVDSMTVEFSLKWLGLN